MSSGDVPPARQCAMCEREAVDPMRDGGLCREHHPDHEARGLAFDYERLRYIQLRGDGSKLPAKSWGGYSQDFEAADHVHTHEDVTMHPADNWGVVDIESPPHSSFSLLIFDIDIHKAPDGFDADRVTVPEDTLVTRSQNGGFHVYFVLNGYERGALQESDFQMTADPGFDVDIRGSVVSHHVVAPADIPGIGGQYDVVNDHEIRAVFEPRAAAERITLDGEPLLEFDPAGGVDSYEFDVPEEPPEEMPRCYHAGLELRKAAPDDHPNTHKVNVLTAACGLAAGYDPETVAGHFCGEWAPTDGDVDVSDKETTEYQVRHIDDGGYSPPAESTLRDYGILDEDEHCEDCPIEYHGSDSSGGDVDHTAVLPPAVRDLSSATTGWDWRHAADRDDDALTIDEARQRTVEAIADAYDGYDHVLVEALPTMGKSYGAVKAAAETNEPVTVLTGRGHKEQYGQFKEWAAEFDLDVYELPAFTHDCDTANGEHGQDWADTVTDWYHRGATPKEIHKSAEYVLGEPLPCQRHSGQDCPYTSKWDFDPDDYDVLLGHYTHAHKSKVTAGRTVVFDEFPDAYETTLVGMKRAISYWLSTVDAIPYDDYADLHDNRDDQQRRGEALLWFEDHGVESDETVVFDDSKAHADAPLAVYTLLAGEDLGNGFEYADLGETGVGVYNRQTSEVSVLRPPPLADAPPSRGPSAIVALDGTPTKRMWELALGERLTHRPVLQDSERAEYIERALNLNFVRSTEYIKSYNSEDHVNVATDRALLEAIADEHGGRPSLITTSTAEDRYDAAGVLDLVDDVKHYGNVLGSNEFDETRLGAVIGSNHYGDHYIQRWAAFAGEAAERNDEKGAALSYGGFGDKILTHMREHDTLQAAMRFGRDGNGAVVYVHTDTLPDWVPLAGEARVVRTHDDGERQVLDAIDGRDYWTTAEIAAADGVEIGESRVRQILNQWTDDGVLEKGQHREDGRAVEWRDAGVDDLPDHVELPAVEDGDADPNGDAESCGNSRMEPYYTWIAATSRPDVSRERSERGESPTVTESAASTGGPPPG